MNGATDAEIEAKIGKILQGADPPDSDADVEDLLVQSGFERPTLFFSSLFWGGWITQRVR
jgi:tRNA (cmo5U34)-methyltransferase